MELERCEAIVLKVADYREYDRLVTCYTLEHGRLGLLARSAKRSARRFGGALELFARLQLQLRLRHGLSDLLEADIVTIHPGIRTDLARIAHAGYVAELVALMAPEGCANPRLFRLLDAYLGHLATAGATADDRRFFEVNLLNILGYRPSLELCGSCGGELGSAAAGAFLDSEGMVLCSACGPHGRPLGSDTLACLGRCLATGRFGMIAFAPQALAEAGELLDAALASHLPHPLRSLEFLRTLC